MNYWNKSFRMLDELESVVKDLFVTNDTYYNDNGNREVELAFAGIKKEDITIDNRGDHLIVKGENEKRKKTYHVTLVDSDHVDGIKAKYSDGMLTLTIPAVATNRAAKEIKIE